MDSIIIFGLPCGIITIFLVYFRPELSVSRKLLAGAIIYCLSLGVGYPVVALLASILKSGNGLIYSMLLGVGSPIICCLFCAKFRKPIPNNKSTEGQSSYYIFSDGEQKGPFTKIQIHEMWISGTLNAASLYWHEELASWEPLTALMEPVENSTGVVFEPVNNSFQALRDKCLQAAIARWNTLRLSVSNLVLKKQLSALHDWVAKAANWLERLAGMIGIPKTALVLCIIMSIFTAPSLLNHMKENSSSRAARLNSDLPDLLRALTSIQSQGRSTSSRQYNDFPSACSSCGGTGKSQLIKCGGCSGRGTIRTPSGYSSVCSQCSGTGEGVCPTCRGSGQSR